MPPRIPGFVSRGSFFQITCRPHLAVGFSTTPGRRIGDSNPSNNLLNNLDPNSQSQYGSTSRSKFESDALISALRKGGSQRSNTAGLQSVERGRGSGNARQLAEMAAASRLRDIESQLRRPFRSGDIYSPHDLSPAEMIKWQRASQPRSARAVANRSKGPRDVFDKLGINPIKHYKNFAMMAEFVTEMGRIKHGRLTGLRPVNQRRLAKAVRRAIGIGLIPSVHPHPEIMTERFEQRRYRIKAP